MITTLLARGAHVNAKDVHGCQPLFLTSIYGHLPAMIALIKAGANIHAVDHFGRTALVMASARGHTDIVRLLLLHGANPLHEDTSGFECTDHARMKKHPAVLDMLKNSAFLSKKPEIRALQKADRVRSASFSDPPFLPSKNAQTSQGKDSSVESQAELYTLMNREVAGGLFERMMNFKIQLDNSLQAPVVKEPVVKEPSRRKNLQRNRSSSLFVYSAPL